MVDENTKMNEVILSYLIFNSEYFIKVFHHMKREYFPTGSSYSDVFNLIDNHFKKFGGSPTKLALELSLDKSGLPQDRFKNAKDLLGRLEPIEGQDLDVIVKMTETHVRNVAYENTVMKIAEIYENEKLPEEYKDKRLPSLESTQEMVAQALAISFENSLGHDYNEGFEERLETYMEGITKIPFRLESMNKMTNGGIGYKTLNIPIAPTGVGKSMWLCSLATDYISDGLDVLYITLEMGEMEVSKRIDANILDISLNNLNKDTINADLYRKKAEEFMKMPHFGKLRIKEYASRTATINDFRALLDDYRIKENFVPDIVIVDYLMIIRHTGRENIPEHERLSRLAVELRAMAFDYDVAVWSPMQTNRDGSDKSDLSISDVAGSFGVTHHADFIMMIIETDDGIDRRVQRIKTVKSRYGSKDENNSIELFVTKAKQRYEDMDEYNSSPPNKPPQMAGITTMGIEDGKLVMDEEKKIPERKINFAVESDATDLDDILKDMDW